MHAYQYALIFAASLGLAALTAPLADRLGRWWGAVDRPGGRRRHERTTSRLGGVAVFAAFIAVVGLTQWQGILTAGYSADDALRLKGLVIGGAVAFLFGLLDDRFDLPPWPQFVLQFGLSLIGLATLLWLESFTLPFLGMVRLNSYPWGPWVYVPLTILWVMGMINTVNWLDGLDGLAAGVGAILCLVLAIHMHRAGQSSVALLPLALMGALTGFLPYNIAPARVFLGSSGAFFLGYALASLGLIAGGRTATVLMVMGLPIVDVAWQIFDRVRHKRSPVEGDRGHLHFRLRDLGLSKRTIVILYWVFCALFGLLALVVAPWQKLAALIALSVGVILVLAVLSRQDEGDNG
ncbi:MAG: MraY family glycosyltransferase [Anaerolineae bacterium]|jgi:UDP-GlcNAc:undecaprenyl-phosphate GlcNAc-1-phosphate transferase